MQSNDNHVRVAAGLFRRWRSWRQEGLALATFKHLEKRFNKLLAINIWKKGFTICQ